MLLGIHALARTHTMVIVILNKLLCLTFLTFRTGALDRDLKWIKGNNVVEVWGNLESAIVIIHAVNCKITPKTIFPVPILLPFCAQATSMFLLDHCIGLLTGHPICTPATL